MRKTAERKQGGFLMQKMRNRGLTFESRKCMIELWDSKER